MITTPRTYLKLREKIGYSLGDTASNLFWMSFMFYLLFFYTDVFGLSAAAAGTMLFFTRIWDTVNTPLIGLIADRTRSRWGKFRPYLLWGAVPFGVFGALTFTTPDLPPAGKLVYAYITYTLMMTIYTFVNLPYSALLGVITPSSEERTTLSTWRFVFAFLGAMTVQYFTLPLVDYFGRGDRAHGYQVTMSCYAVLAVVLLWIAFFSTRERVRPRREQKTSVKRDLKDLLRNKPWIILFFVSFITMVYFSIRGGTTLYYFKYYVGRPELASLFMVGGSAFLVLGVLSTKWLNLRFNRARLFASLLTIDGLVMALFYFPGPDDWWWMYTVNFLAHFFIGPTIVMIWAMYADTADYSEWRTGRRATALVFSAAMFAQKMGGALGSAAIGWLLALYGFQANTEQSSHTLQGIRLLMSVYPMGLALAAATVVLFYRLDRNRMRRIESTLRRRLSADAGARPSLSP